jgi:hypothetical protein
LIIELIPALPFLLRPQAQQLAYVAGQVEGIGHHATPFQRHGRAQLRADVGEQGVTPRHALGVKRRQAGQIRPVVLCRTPDGDPVLAHFRPPSP